MPNLVLPLLLTLIAQGTEAALSAMYAISLIQIALCVVGVSLIALYIFKKSKRKVLSKLLLLFGFPILAYFYWVALNYHSEDGSMMFWSEFLPDFLPIVSIALFSIVLAVYEIFKKK